MENDPLKLYNKKTFIKLFESSNDSSDKLYKNTLLDFGDEFAKKNIEETNIESNIKEYTHNSLLNRISMEDYYLFPPNPNPGTIVLYSLDLVCSNRCAFLISGGL